MDSLYEFIDDTWKSIFSLSQFHINLYQMSNLKILNGQELSQNPYIADQLKLCRNQLAPIKEEIEATSEKIKEAIEAVTLVKEMRKSQIEENLLIRVLSRAIQVAHSPLIKKDNIYYQLYNQKFRIKCTRVIKDIKNWEVFEVLKILYKYFRHVVLIQLERYQEILDCLTQSDFQSLSKFKDYFYEVLQKKESSIKQSRFKDSPNSVAPPVRQISTPPISYEPTQTIPKIQEDQEQFHPINPQFIPQENQEFVHDDIVVVQSMSSQLYPMINNVQGDIPPKRRQENKSSKKLFFLLGPVMSIKKEHFIAEYTNKSEEHSMLVELLNRNKVNHKQISDYFSYAQQMEKRLSHNHTADFYYYKEEPSHILFNEDKAFTQKKRIRVAISRDKRQSIFGFRTKMKSQAQLDINRESPQIHRTKHIAINCRDKADPNAEVKPKPQKIDNYLGINLKKIPPARRQSRLFQMGSQTAFGTIKHEFQTRRVQASPDNTDKVSQKIVSPVKILHEKQFKTEKEVKLKLYRDKNKHYLEHNRINNKINEELKGQHLEGWLQDSKKIWRGSITFKKLQIS